MQIGTVLRGRWSVERALGQGGTAGVYLARDLRLDCLVAIKESILTGDAASQASVRTQMEREARLLAELRHPRIVRVLEYLDCGPQQYLIMDYVDGRNLECVVQDSAEDLSVGRIWHWCEQILDALEYLHGHQPPIMFRDLKPANIMVDANDQICLVDFGIARRCEPGHGTASYLKCVGTPGYAPVEQYYGHSDDPRSDIYSLGATLYALLTRREPPPSVALLSGDADLASPRSINPDVTPELDGAVLHMMALRKEQRPSCVADMRVWFQKPWGRRPPASTPTTVLEFDTQSATASALAPISSCRCRPDQPELGCPQHSLPFAGPFSILFRGTLEAAQKVCGHCRKVGLGASLLYAQEPTAPRAGGWLVVVAHALSRS